MNKLQILILVSIFSGACSLCSSVQSEKYGRLDIEQSTFVNNPKCVKNLRFKNRENGESFCMKKWGENDKITCVKVSETGCECGVENKPRGLETKISGGDQVAENQFPWHALVISNRGMEN